MLETGEKLESGTIKMIGKNDQVTEINKKHMVLRKKEPMDNLALHV